MRRQPRTGPEAGRVGSPSTEVSIAPVAGSPWSELSGEGRSRRPPRINSGYEVVAAFVEGRRPVACGADAHARGALFFWKLERRDVVAERAPGRRLQFPLDSFLRVAAPRLGSSRRKALQRLASDAWWAVAPPETSDHWDSRVRLAWALPDTAETGV